MQVIQPKLSNFAFTLPFSCGRVRDRKHRWVPEEPGPGRAGAHLVPLTTGRPTQQEGGVGPGEGAEERVWQRGAGAEEGRAGVGQATPAAPSPSPPAGDTAVPTSPSIADASFSPASPPPLLRKGTTLPEGSSGLARLTQPTNDRHAPPSLRPPHGRASPAPGLDVRSLRTPREHFWPLRLTLVTGWMLIPFSCVYFLSPRSLDSSWRGP